MLVLGNADIHAALTPELCEAAMVDALVAHAEGRASFPLRTVVSPPGAGALLGLMPAYRSDSGCFGLKAVCVVTESKVPGVDSHQGLVALFSAATGFVTALLNASAITEIRTAAVTTAATRRLAREDAGVLAIVGAGVQGRAHLRALRDARAWREVRITSRTKARAEALAADAETLIGSGPAVLVMPDARSAITGGDTGGSADVIVLATSSKEPVIERAWLAAGSHLNAVGASSPSARELDVQTIADAALFCESRTSIRNEALEFRLASEQGVIEGESHIQAELGELFSGAHPGRRDDAELTVFRSLGVGIEDLFAAELAVSRARELGLGTEVTL